MCYVKLLEGPHQCLLLLEGGGGVDLFYKYNVKSPEGTEKIQQDLDNLMKWSSQWQLDFNEAKCKVIHLGTANSRHHAIHYEQHPIGSNTRREGLGCGDRSFIYTCHRH